MKRSGFVGINSVVSATGATVLHTAVLCTDSLTYASLCWAVLCCVMVSAALVMPCALKTLAVYIQVQGQV